MSRFTERLYRDAVQALLAPGERLLAVLAAAEPPGAEDAAFRRAARGGPAAVDDRWVRGFNVVDGLDVNTERVVTALFGTSGYGGPGTAGARLWAAFDPAAGTSGGLRATLVAVTDRRLLALAGRTVDAATSTATVVTEVPRGDVVSAVRAGRLQTRGRVELRFADGSAKALFLGAARARYARTLVDTLNAAAG